MTGRKVSGRFLPIHLLCLAWRDFAASARFIIGRTGSNKRHPNDGRNDQ